MRFFPRVTILRAILPQIVPPGSCLGKFQWIRSNVIPKSFIFVHIFTHKLFMNPYNAMLWNLFVTNPNVITDRGRI